MALHIMDLKICHVKHGETEKSHDLHFNTCFHYVHSGTTNFTKVEYR